MPPTFADRVREAGAKIVASPRIMFPILVVALLLYGHFG